MHKKTSLLDSSDDEIKLTRMSCLTSDKVSCTEADVMSSEHCKLEIHATCINEMTNRLVKVDAEKVINDIKRREIPRFRVSKRLHLIGCHSSFSWGPNVSYHTPITNSELFQIFP